MNAPLPPDAVACAQLPVADICPSPSNPRKHFDEAYLAELAETIKVHGILQPITVRPNPKGSPTYELVVGECRWRSAQLAGLVEIPAFWRELDDREVLEIQVVENLQRRDVYPIEEAEGYELLMKRHGYNADQIAEKIGKSRSYVYARLKLTALCAAAREACYEGQLETSTALLIARIPGDKLQAKALKRVLEGNYAGPMSYRDAKYYIRHGFTISLKQATFSLTDPALIFEAGSCTDCPKRSGNCTEICADLEGDADVCTDTECFEKKKDARRQQLLDRAADRGVPVIGADNSLRYDGMHDGKAFHDLDDVVDGDAEGRSYREILGDDAPIGLVANMSYTDKPEYTEFGEVTALEEALRKAGWQPVAEEGGDPDDAAEERAEAQREREEEARARQAKYEADQRARENETAYRKALRDTIATRLHAECNAGELNTDPIVRALAIAWLRREIDLCGELPEDLLKEWGIEAPPAADHADDEDDGPDAWTTLDAICQQIEHAPIGTVLGFLFTCFVADEQKAGYAAFGPSPAKPEAMLAMARAIDLFDPEALRPAIADGTEKAGGAIEAAPAGGESAEDDDAPTEAAPAAEGSDEEGEDPAPASPANGTKKPSAAYRHPETGMTWSGRGRKPKWVENWLAEGGTIEALRP